MTAGELIAQLVQHSADTPVCVVIEDEDGASQPVDVFTVERVIQLSGAATYIEVIGVV